MSASLDAGVDESERGPRCTAPQTLCGVACVDVQGDRDHCGACGVRCPGGEVCAVGRCVLVCPAGQQECDGQCVTLRTDRAHCGACATACARGLVCAEGRCAVECGARLAGCGDAADLVCIDLQTDRLHCGACDRACASGNVCAGGRCEVSCVAPLLQCGDRCADTKSDPTNCGACGTVCAGGLGASPSCVGGVCRAVCRPGFADCDGAAANGCEVDTLNSPQHCGACGAACAGVCAGGLCLVCDSRVLVLGSDHAARDQEMVAAMRAAGLDPTLVEHGVTTYAGVPAASEFGVVVPVAGDTYEVDMPMAGQVSIAAAQAAGHGVVFSEWFATHRLADRWEALDSLLLITRASGANAVLQFTSTVAHPIWTGLPRSFASAIPLGANVAGALVHGGTEIASSPQSGVAVAVRAAPHGRVVQLAFSAQYTASGNDNGLLWTIDATTTRMFTNAVLWAAGCR